MKHQSILRTHGSTGHFPEMHILTQNQTPVTTERPRSSAKKRHFASKEIQVRTFLPWLWLLSVSLVLKTAEYQHQLSESKGKRVSQKLFNCIKAFWFCFNFACSADPVS